MTEGYIALRELTPVIGLKQEIHGTNYGKVTQAQFDSE